MPQDIVITPSSGKIEFSQNIGGSVVANIQLDPSSSDLSLITTSGNLILGDASKDVFIGDGINNVDIIFEQDGEIRGLTNKTLTLGQNDSIVNFNTSKTTFSAGNVAIGHTTPNYLTDIQSTSSPVTLNFKLNKSSTANDYAEIAFQLWSGAGTGVNTFGGAGTSRPSVVLRALNENSSTAAGAFVVGTFTGGSTNSTLTEKFRITSAGNVGIGTTTPAAALQIGQLTPTSATAGLQFGDDTGTRIYRTGSGTLTMGGTFIATTFSGSGASLTSLNASNLSSGTVPGDRGVTAGSASVSFVEYNGTTATAGQFDGGTTNPSATTRLNYGGYLYATRFYGDGSNLTGVTGSSFGSQTANTFFAAPNGTAGNPTFRAIVAADVPTLNQNTTGSAATLTTTRTLWGQNFNGSANVTGSLTSVGDITGSSAITITAGGSNQNVTITPSGTGYTLLNGNVGIGTITPGHKLHVVGTAANLVRFQSTSASGPYVLFENASAIFGDIGSQLAISGTGSASNMFINARSSGSLILGTGDTARVTVDSSGNVGIGTTNPAAKLQINSTGDIAYQILNTTATANKRVRLQFTQNNNAGLELGTDYGSNNTSNFYLYDRVNNHTFAFFSNATTWFNGDVGIGTVSPANKLSVIGTANIGSASYNTAGPTNGLIVEGNVGIGTTSPSQKLEVQGNIKLGADNSGSYIYYVKDNEGTIVRTTRSDVSQEGLLRSDGWGNFTFNKSVAVGYSLGSGPLTGNIYASGSIGIGTTSPATTLQIGQLTPTSATAGLQFGDDTGTRIYRSASNTLTMGGTFIATTFSGSGASLTSLNASNLSSGTVPGDRGVTAGSATVSFVEYNGTTATAGQFDGGTTNPSATTRLNYGGYLYATRFYGDGSNLTGVTGSSFGSQTANTFFAAPNGTAGNPTFRAIVAADVPTLNQNTTGSAATLTTTRTLWGQNFNGSANVTGSLTSVGDITGSSAITITAGGSNQNVTITPSGTGYTLLNGNVGIGTASPSNPLDVAVSVASSNYLGNAAVYPLAIKNNNTTAGNAVGMTFGQGGYGYTNFIASVRTGTGANPKGDLVLGGRPSDGSAFTEIMRLQAGGNVGIGTTSPSEKLHVKGTTLIENEANSSGALRNSPLVMWTDEAFGMELHYSNSSWQTAIFGRQSDATVLTLGSYSGNETQQQNFNHYLTIRNTGNVGVGTESPVGKFDVRPDASYPQAEAFIVDTDGSQNPRIRLYRPDGGSATTAYPIHIKNQLGDLNILTGNSAVLGSETVSSKLYLTSAGNLGIGTTSPSNILDINGSTRIRSISASGSAGTIFLTTDANGVIVSRTAAQVRSDIGAGTGNGTVTSITAGDGLSGGTITSSGTIAVDSTVVRTSGNQTIGGTKTFTASTYLATSSGSVGIGTTIPAYKLDTTGTFNFDISGSLHFRSYSFGTDLIVDQVSVGGWARGNRIYNSNYTAGTSFFGVLGSESAVSYAYWTLDNPASVDATGYNSTKGIFLYPTGNVMVGSTSTPANKFVVTGAASIGSATYNASAPTNGLIIEGNVGIGVTSPSAKLEVNAGSLSSTSGSNLGIAIFTSALGNASYLKIIEKRFSTGSDWTTATTRIQKTIDSTDQAYIDFNPSNAAYGIAFGTGATTPSQRMVIDINGNVGIGTTSPSNILDINGSTRIRSISASGSAGTIFLTTDANGVIVSRTAAQVRSDIGAGTGNGTVTSITAGDGLSGGTITSSGTIAVDSTVVRTSGNQTIGGTKTFTAETYLATSSGNVGIGTTVPNRKLEIAAGTGGPALRLTNTNSNSGIEILTAASTYSWLLGAQYNVGGAFEITPSTTVGGTTFSTPIAVFTQTGNVGIGTVTPSVKFHLEGGGANNIVSALTSFFGDGNFKVGTINGTSTNSSGEIIGKIGSYYSFGNLNSFIRFHRGGGATDGYMSFSTNSDVERVRIDANGNVGIGTSIPAAILNVKTSTIVNREVFMGDSTAPSGVFRARLDDNSLSFISLENRDTAATTNHGVGIRFNLGTSASNNAINAGGIYLGKEQQWTATASTQDSYLIFNTALDGTASEKVRITSAGNVGVGTVSPRNQLSVIGSAQAVSAITDAGSDGGTILIGSSTNAVGQGGTLLFATINDGGNYTPQWGIKSMFVNGNNNGIGDLVFSSRNAGTDTALTERIRLKYSGEVGIGTSSPATALQIGQLTPTSATAGLQFGDDTGTRIYRSASNTLTMGGTFIATTFSGSGASLTSLNASNLSSGTVPGDRGVTAGSASASFVEYNGTTKTAGQFDGGTTAPTNTTRLNYDGYLYATRFYGDGSNLTGVTGSSFGSQTANTFFAAPNGSSGNPTFRAIVAADIPTLNQNTTGSAATLTTTRTLWGQNFNGSANVTGSLTSVGDITGSSAITITAGGSNQNVTITPSGTGYTLLNGNVGIGTATPVAKLQSISNIAAANHDWTSQFAAPTVGLLAASNDSSAWIRIATYNSNPTHDPFLNFLTAGGQNWSIGIDNSDSDKLKIAMASSFNGTNEFLAIDTSNNVGIGTSAPAVLLHIGGSSQTTAAYGLRFGLDSSANLYRSASATVRTDGSLTVGGTVTELSALKYKENISPLSNILNKLCYVQPVTYNKKGEDKKEYGVIAEEVAELFPELVSYNNDGELESVNYSRLTVLLIQAVKELKSEIDKLKKK